MTAEMIRRELLAHIVHLSPGVVTQEVFPQLRKTAIEDQQNLKKRAAALPREQYVQYYRGIAEAIGFYNLFWNCDFFDLFTELVAIQPTTADALLMTGLELKQRGNFEGAIQVMRRSVKLENDIPFIAGMLGELLREAGRLDEARDYCKSLLERYPFLSEPKSTLIACDTDELFEGALDYYHLLAAAHKNIKPTTYLEVGVATGKSLALVREGTIAIGVDPKVGSTEQLLFHSLKNEPHVFALTSDELFRQQIPIRVFEDKPLDMVFLDGLHTFDQTLRDFINAEKLSHSDTVVFIHDCLPVAPISAERERQTNFWIGDVWKMIPCLKAARPDLEITTLKTPPSGLAVIRGLDRHSTILDRQYSSLVSHYMDLPLPESMKERFELLNVTEHDPLAVIPVPEKHVT